MINRTFRSGPFRVFERPSTYSGKLFIGRPGPDRRKWIIRPDDLLVLGFDLINLQVQKGEGGVPAILVKQGGGPGYLVVWFPPQHLTEVAYFTTVEAYPIKTPVNNAAKGEIPKLDDPDQDHTTEKIDDPDPRPIDAILAGWSRLVFRVPDDDLPIEWTLPELLKAMGELELSVPRNALPPSRPRVWTADAFLNNFARAALDTTALILASSGSEAAPLAQALQDLYPPSGGGIISTARARRRLRTLGNQFGSGGATGVETIGFQASLVDDLLVSPLLPILMRPEPQPPAVNQTAIELPYRLLLSPNRFAAWFHSIRAATSPETGHTELWHTRLGVRRPDGSLAEGEDWRRTLRAVWTKDTDPSPSTPEKGQPVYIPDHSNDPFRMSLDSFDRHNVVHLSSNFRLEHPDNPNAYYEPPPIDVDLLALTSLGSWLDSRGEWDTPQPKGLSVEEWRHRATLGRDHYVRVVYAGFLFPWGHRASLVKVTERQFHEDKAGNPAYLRQRMFLVVREPLKTYRNTNLAKGPETAGAGEQFDLMMPFESVRITTRVSPLLDPPELGGNDIESKKQGCFWPYVGGQPFKFHLVGTDTAGNQVDMAMPMIFVGKEETDKDQPDSIIPGKVADSYATKTWKYSNTLLATVPLGGQRMAFAESAAPDDTTFDVQSLTFGAEVPQQEMYNKLPWQKPRFFPVVRSALIDVPSLQSIARTSQPAGVLFSETYLKEGFGGSNAGQVFLKADPALPALGVSFSSQGDRSGALVTPDLALSGLSRITGPISGDLAAATAGSFDPDAWFGMLSGAKLFGVFSLTDILETVGFNELDKLPQFVGQSLNQVEQVIAELERLQEILAINPVSETANTTFLLDQLLDPTTGSIPGLFKGGSAATVAGQLGALAGELGTLQTALPGSSMPPGPKARIVAAINMLQDGINTLLAAAGLLQAFAEGELLPEVLEARFEWRPVIKGWGPFQPDGDRNLLLAVQAAGEEFSVVCSLDKFVLNIVFLILDFERVQFRVESGKKPEVEVKFNGFEFIGPLSFVETLRNLIPFDGFADPPDVTVTAEGIKASFSMGLPNIAVGVFSLENLSLAAGFSVPFLGPPLSTWFRFCERENPARLTVSLFGGGFFFGLTVNPDGLQILEGAIEFGAAISVNFGVASGSVSAMAGLYFKIEGSDATLAGYFRLRGEVRALGIVSVSIELYLELRYETGSGKCVGTATLSIEIDIAFFSVTISITCTKKFAGSNGDPTFAELMEVAPNATSADWTAYCQAFA
jgi:hypothetical protein